MSGRADEFEAIIIIVDNADSQTLLTGLKQSVIGLSCREFIAKSSSTFKKKINIFI